MQNAVPPAIFDKGRGSGRSDDAWAVFAGHLERRVILRARISADRALSEASENPDLGRADN